ncbi:MAG TPA: competence/damage-inducible protein A [Polyangiaceae bacterium]
MSAAVFCIGTELTRGELVNGNATWIADALTAIGLEVTELECTDDDRARIRAHLARLCQDHDLVVCTGGLGPTTDDLTTECVAELLGVPLERHDESLAVIRARMERFGRVMAASNAKQADFPRGARVLPNRHGTAPGFSVRIGRALAFFLPGVPREMRGLFEEHVAADARALVSEHVHQVILRSFGVTESAINDRLAGIAEEHGVTIGYRAHFPEIEVKLLARAHEPAAAAASARAAADAVQVRVGTDIVYGEGRRALPEVVGALLSERQLKIGLAESCTGGLASMWLTDQGGSSAYFAGAVVVYSNALKHALLGVPSELLERHGAVSREVALSMAECARSRLGVDVSLSLTGVAGPSGGTPEKPVGLVHFAVATASGATARHIQFPGTRDQVRKLSAFAGLALVRRVLLHGHEER